MDATVTSAIIAAIGAILGAIAKTLAPDLRLLLTGKTRTNSDLVGKWKCSWVVTRDTGEKKEINDIASISKVWGEELWAKGTNTEYGNYEIRGRISRSALVTLHYHRRERSLLLRSHWSLGATGAIGASPTLSMKDRFDQTGRPAHRSSSKG